jgi:hypothetical protein
VFIVLLSANSAFTQLPDGFVAPEFTWVDIEGNTHTLSDYLAEGNWVFLDIFAVWCTNSVNQLPNIENSYADFGSARKGKLTIFLLRNF